MVGFRTRVQLLEGGRFHAGMAYIQNQVEAFPEVVGPLHNHIQGLEAFRRHMALGCYFRFSAIEVEPYKNPELVIQMLPLSRILVPAATLRPVPSLGSECDVRNIYRHIGKPRVMNGGRPCLEAHAAVPLCRNGGCATLRAGGAWGSLGLRRLVTAGPAQCGPADFRAPALPPGPFGGQDDQRPTSQDY